MNAAPDIDDAIDVMLRFVSEMNDWQNRMYYLSRRQSAQVIPESKRHLIEGLEYESYMKAYYDIFQRYCTQRKRAYNGFPGAWTKDGTYRGIDKNTIQETILVNTKRIEIIAKGGIFENLFFKFVLFKKKRGWLIDHLLSRIGDNTEWRNTCF